MTRFESEATLYQAKMTWTLGRVREIVKRKEIMDSPCFSCKDDPNKAVWSIRLDFGNATPEVLTLTCTNHSLTREIFVESLSFKIAAKGGSPLEGGFRVNDITFGGANSESPSLSWITNAKLPNIFALTEKSKPLQDGNLYLTCKIKYYGNLKTHQKSGPLCKPCTLPRDREMANFDVSRGDILSSLARDLKSLALDVATADVEVVVGENRIPAHRSILMARSPVFREMLNNAASLETSLPPDGAVASVTSRPELKVYQENPAVIDALVKFCYSGKIPRDLDSMAKELLVAADFYQIKTLKDVCSEWLAKQLCLKNAVQLMTVAHLHDCAQLKSASMELVVKHAAKFMAQDDWGKFACEFPDLLNEVCRSLASSKK